MGSIVGNIPRKYRNLLLVLVISSVLVSSIVIVDISAGEHEYEMPDPIVHLEFPEILYFYNISEGVSVNTFSCIFEFPSNISGSQQIIAREVSLIFWFKDITDGSSVSTFIYNIHDNLRNCSVSLNNHIFSEVNSEKDGWWASSELRFVFNEEPSADSITLGVAFEIFLINQNGPTFDNHEVKAQMDMNVTYSRWWQGIRINDSHQTNSYLYKLTPNGIVTIESLVYGLPNQP